MPKKIDSIKHKDETRLHTPSSEEQGYEEESAKVREGKQVLELPINPVTTRGQDPELYWMNKYGNDDREELLSVDIRSLYRHEHIAPERLIKNLYRVTEDDSSQKDLFEGGINELFGNALDKDELQKIEDYYSHQDGWTNRLIQGDSHLVMASLLEREGMAGQVQMIYMDPPYGIKYGSNWQIKLNNRDVKDGKDEDLSGEPEVIKAFRDTWELGIHSYLSYIRDRLLIAKELLTESGSCFVQISDENVHLVRSVMDEVFGSSNFVNQISFQKSGGKTDGVLASVTDFLLWYAKDKDTIKSRMLYLEKTEIEKLSEHYKYDDGDGRLYRLSPINSQHYSPTRTVTITLGGKEYHPGKNRQWSVDPDKIPVLYEKGLLRIGGNSVYQKLYLDQQPGIALTNLWNDTARGSFHEKSMYVVQTTLKTVQRCILLTTDPGDLVLDPTCGSGTTAFVAEQFGRRWITTDTSRIALNIAKTRLMTATLPFYKLYDEEGQDIRQGFIYKTVPHITLKSLANDEPPATETLYDKPEIDKKRMRVSGPFMVETLQNFDPIAPEDLDKESSANEEEGSFDEVIKQHLLSTGVKNGRKDEQVSFSRVELLSHEYLHAEGFYMNGTGEKKAYFHIGPKFGTVSKKAVNEAIKEVRARNDGAAWLIILGFSFESDIHGSTETTSMGSFEVTKARIHDDLLQEGLKKKPAKSAASFVTIGEPDIDLNRDGDTATVEIKGLDIYDPIKDEVKARDVHDIAYWMVDDNYDGSSFIVNQVFFCGGDKDEFKKWQKGLDNLAKDRTRLRAERTLKIEIDDEAFDRIYGHISHPIIIKSLGQKIAVRVISQYGEESTKILSVT